MVDKVSTTIKARVLSEFGEFTLVNPDGSNVDFQQVLASYFGERVEIVIRKADIFEEPKRKQLHVKEPHRGMIKS